MVLISVLLISVSVRADVAGEARVVNGVTLLIGDVSVRLEGVDPPQADDICHDVTGLSLRCTGQATDWLRRMIGGKRVVCLGDKINRVGFLLATCYVGSRNLNGALVLAGWARAGGRFGYRYDRLQARAKTAGVGLHAAP